MLKDTPRLPGSGAGKQRRDTVAPRRRPARAPLSTSLGTVARDSGLDPERACAKRPRAGDKGPG